MRQGSKLPAVLLHHGKSFFLQQGISPFAQSLPGTPRYLGPDALCTAKKDLADHAIFGRRDMGNTQQDVFSRHF